MLVSWSAVGTKIISKLNPSLKHELTIAMHPALDVWITLPDFADGKPIIISTPAGVRFDHQLLTVPQGSIVSAHLAEHDGDTPELIVDSARQPFITDSHGDYAANRELTEGKKLTIRRGWLTLASWHVHVVPDTAPHISMLEKPSITESKAVRLSYAAANELGVANISLRVTPHSNLPGANNTPVEIALPFTEGPALLDKIKSYVDFQDLTGHPWAGQTVSLQLVATSQTGKRGTSDAVDFTLPERSFSHPIARMLIDERKKLLLTPDDQKLREEIANVMAGVAHESAIYRSDPVVMMALRSGAVRLVLNHDHGTALSINDLLWESATRIEDGSDGHAQRALRDARQDLSEALDRSASKDEIAILNDRLKAALKDYLLSLSTSSVVHPSPLIVKKGKSPEHSSNEPAHRPFASSQDLR